MTDECVARLEIDLWRDDLRLEGMRLCRHAHNNALERAKASIDALSDRDLVLPKSKAWGAIQDRLRSDINMLSKRLARRLDESCRDSFARIEALGDAGPDYGAAGMYGFGALIDLGSVGAAMSAGTLATTTIAATGWLALFGAAPVVVMSWPVFAAVGSVAVVGALASPSFIIAAKRKQRQRLVAQTDKTLARYVSDRTAEASALRKFFDLVDRIARDRKDALDAG